MPQLLERESCPLRANKPKFNLSRLTKAYNIGGSKTSPCQRFSTFLSISLISLNLLTTQPLPSHMLRHPASSSFLTTFSFFMSFLFLFMSSPTHRQSHFDSRTSQPCQQYFYRLLPHGRDERPLRVSTAICFQFFMAFIHFHSKKKIFIYYFM